LEWTKPAQFVQLRFIILTLCLFYLVTEIATTDSLGVKQDFDVCRDAC